MAERKNIKSLIKKRGVTMIFLIGFPFLSGFKFEAFVLMAVTTVEMNNVPPKIRLMEVVPSITSPSLPELAANEAKKSGAPFPKARRVTPANDSGILNLVVIKAKLGER